MTKLCSRANLTHPVSALVRPQLARLFAVAFLEDPGRTFVGAISVAVEAKSYAQHHRSDPIMRRYVHTLAENQQLAVAGALNAISDQAVIAHLLSSDDGQEALADATQGGCRVVLALPHGVFDAAPQRCPIPEPLLKYSTFAEPFALGIPTDHSHSACN